MEGHYPSILKFYAKLMFSVLITKYIHYFRSLFHIAVYTLCSSANSLRNFEL